ncbi:MAG: type VI secretion system baseplate subunit TssE [Gammaproteobacteria bacterium]
MAELTQQERLQPSLLDRLTDEEPTKTQESRDKRVLSLQKLREGVLRDMAWLLNSGNLATTEDLSAYPFVAQSVLNYGMPDMAGLTVSGADVSAIERELKQAILTFEPRILRNTLKVRVVVADDRMDHNTMTFDIEGELWAQPAPLRLYLKTEIDFESGNVEVLDAGGRRTS